MPLSITAIAGLQLHGGLVALPMALSTPANMVLGVVITGWSAKLFTLAMAFLPFYQPGNRALPVVEYSAVGCDFYLPTVYGL